MNEVYDMQLEKKFRTKKEGLKIAERLLKIGRAKKVSAEKDV